MLDLNFVRDNLELVKEKMRERGLTEIEWPARMQRLRSGPLVALGAAHAPDAIQAREPPAAL